MSRALLVLVVLACLCVSGLAQFNHTLRWDKATNTYNVTADPTWGEFVCEAVYVPTYEASGWDILAVAPAKTLLEEPSTQGRAYFAAGYLEGYLTHQRIFDHWRNVAGPVNSTLSHEANTYIVEQYAQMSKIASGDRPSGVSDDLGRQIGNQLEQMKGMGAGYRAAHTAAAESLTDADIYRLSLYIEMGDIEKGVAPQLVQDMWKKFPQLAPGMSDVTCSAIVKLTDKDLFVAHNTFTWYNTMMRIFKSYRFQATVTMSGYPGIIHGVDDWYMTSRGLAVQETTNGNYNISLAHKFVKSTNLAEFMRVMAANYLANSGKEWIDIFSVLNSGTYNNQWMCVDMKLFTPGKEVADNTLWVAEQMPGTIEAADQSKVLREKKYWASYNRPFYKKIRDISQTTEKEAQYGSYFSYANYSRAQIFERDQAKVTDLESLKKLMRYNDYENEVYSLIPYCKGATGDVCNPKFSPYLSIAARNDLAAPGDKTNYGELWDQFVPRCRGATDAKITSWSMMQNKTLTGVVITGPTSDKQPTFDWSAAVCNNDTDRHHGHPARFTFTWQTIETEAQTIPVKKSDEEKSKALIIVIVIVGIIVIAAVGFVIARKTCFPAEPEAAYKAV